LSYNQFDKPRFGQTTSLQVTKYGTRWWWRTPVRWLCGDTMIMN